MKYELRIPVKDYRRSKNLNPFAKAPKPGN
jgi:hypothetical protein